MIPPNSFDSISGQNFRRPHIVEVKTQIQSSKSFGTLSLLSHYLTPCFFDLTVRVPQKKQTFRSLIQFHKQWRKYPQTHEIIIVISNVDNIQIFKLQGIPMDRRGEDKVDVDKLVQILLKVFLRTTNKGNLSQTVLETAFIEEGKKE